jgi:hypothetical protein
MFAPTVQEYSDQRNAGEGVSDFLGYYLYHRQSTAGVACLHGIHRSTLLQIPAQEGKLSAAGSSR